MYRNYVRSGWPVLLDLIGREAWRRYESVEIRDDDLNVGFYEGNGLLLEDAVKEQVLLTLPMKNVCRPDCAGLCPQCGQNCNLGDCTCDKAAADPRWAALGPHLKRPE